MRRQRALLLHAISFGLAALAAAIVILFAPAALHGMVRAVAAYDAAAVTLLLWYWVVALETDAQQLRLTAAVEDPGRDAVFGVVLAAVGFGLVGAIEILGKRAHAALPLAPLTLYTLGIGAVVLGWLLIHTICLFRYARLYYGDANRDEVPDGGLIFPGTEDPSDLDFAYFSFVVGMTFQVSDVQVTSKRIRRLVLAHGLISFAYNVAILALAISIVSDVLRQ